MTSEISDERAGSPSPSPSTTKQTAVAGVSEKSALKTKSGGAWDNDSVDSAKAYEPVASYEGRHRFDPEFQWEDKEEKRVVRKIDVKICAWVCFMFFCLQLDRGNIKQALSDNMLNDLGLTTNDYNTGQTIFYLTFLFAEIPSQLISKKLGPDNWIPIQMVSWSLVASFQAFLSGRSSFWATRALLGLIEGGFIPDNILYLSYFYKNSELPRRLSFFWTSYEMTTIIGSFLAFGILRMRGILGLAGWRWLFALEGTFTGLAGIVSWFYLPPSPTQTASRFRGKDGWFSEREEKIMVNRILRDDPSKGDMHNRQGLTIRNILDCVWDYHMWPIYLLGLTWVLPTVPISQYLTLVLRSNGFGTFETNLLTIPASAIFICGLLFWTWVSEKVNDRFLVGTITQIWCFPILIALITLPPNRNPWAAWTLATLQYAQPYIHAVLVALTSRNAGSVRTRTVASAFYNVSVQISNIIGSNIYRTNDAPNYYTGNKVLLGIVCYNFCLFIAIKLFYVHVNKRRDQKWNAMSKEEKQTYLATTTDKGNKRLDFRFAH